MKQIIFASKAEVCQQQELFSRWEYMCSSPLSWKAAWLPMHSLLEGKSPNEPVNTILMAIIFLFLSCLGRRYLYSWIIILCKLSKNFDKYCLQQIIVWTFLFIQFLSQVPSLLHELAWKFIFSFYKNCQSDKATALNLTFFFSPHKASFDYDKIRR